jgi:hypothetical protein
MVRQFRNERGFSSAVLRTKEDESIDEAITRLKSDGWIIDDYSVTEDPNGHTMIIPKPGTKPEESEVSVDD